MSAGALIIFDIDGTLLQSDTVTVPAVQQTFAEFGLPSPKTDVIIGFLGKPVEDYEVWLVEQCTVEQAEDLVAATNARELACIGETGKLYPEAHEVLHALLAAGYDLAVCSNGPDAYVEEVLIAHDLDAYFELVEARGRKTGSKTNMIGRIMREIETRPVFVVGDREDDIAAAQANGAWAIAATYGYGSHEELAGADMYIEKLASLPKVIEQLLP